jgi:hypothetical protein
VSGSPSAALSASSSSAAGSTTSGAATGSTTRPLTQAGAPSAPSDPTSGDPASVTDVAGATVARTAPRGGDATLEMTPVMLGAGGSSLSFGLVLLSRLFGRVRRRSANALAPPGTGPPGRSRAKPPDPPVPRR